MFIWDRNLKILCVSKCGRKHWAEAVVRIRASCIVVEIEQTGIGTIVEVAPAHHERIGRVHEVRVVQFNPYILKQIVLQHYLLDISLQICTRIYVNFRILASAD